MSHSIFQVQIPKPLLRHSDWGISMIYLPTSCKFSTQAGSLLFLLFLFSSNALSEDSSSVPGAYLGQIPPGDEPRLFMPGVVSTNYIDHCVGFLEGGKVGVFSTWEKGTYSLYEKDGRWTQPELVPWQNERGATDFTVGPDDSTVYFQSARPTALGDENRESNTWKVEWTGDGWTEAVPLPSPANTEEFSEGYPSVAPDGSIYFFSTSRPDASVGDIFRSRLVDGAYVEAERLSSPVNSDYYEVDPFIAPDGSYLLFGSGRPGGYSLLDLYVSFLGDDGHWTHPINTGPKLNPFSIPTRMSVTPDGKHFFFPSRHETDVRKGEDVVSSNVERWGDYDIYWVDTSFISDLRVQYSGKKSAAMTIAQEYRERGVISAATLLSDLYKNDQDGYFFELSEFMIFYGDLMNTGKTEEAEQLYLALLKAIPEEFRIRQGYAVTCILNGQASRGLDLIKEVWAQFPSRKPEDAFMIPFQLRMKEQTEDELKILRFFIQENPDSTFAHFDLATAHERYGNFEEALEHCLKALKLSPTFKDAIKMRERLASR